MEASTTFGPFRLDRAAAILFHGAKPVPLGQRAVALLAALLEADGAPVSKDVLVAAAWPDQAVEESNLTVQMAAVRRALAQAGGETWIDTLPRRGYRYVGPPINLGSDRSGPAPALVELPVRATPESKMVTPFPLMLPVVATATELGEPGTAAREMASESHWTRRGWRGRARRAVRTW